MVQSLDEPVAVSVKFDHPLVIKNISWRQHLYVIQKLGFHHSFYRGRTLYHVFSLISETLFFRLIFDTETLTFRLTEISDGEAS